MMSPLTLYGSTARRLDPRAPGLTMGEAVAYFLRRRSAISLIALLLTAIAARLWVGGFTWWDAAIAASLVGVHPLSEWIIHVELLHFRPRRWLGLSIDPAVSKAHRAHHADPHDPKWWFIPMRSGVVGSIIVTGLAFLLAPIPLALTIVVAALALTTTYEWTHFMCHSSWRPRSKFYRDIWRLHRLHHFKNENYWMGVTNHAADRLLGTMPEPDQVETSPTCRNLHDR